MTYSFLRNVNTKPFSTTLMIALSLVLSGCVYNSPPLIDQTQIDSVVKDEIAIPNAWAEGIENNPAIWQSVGDEIIANKNFYAGIEDINNDELLKYIDIALNNNFNLQAAASRLLASFEQIDVAAAALFPQVTGSISGAKREIEVEGQTPTVRTNQASIALSWELDVWGKLSDANSVAKYSALEQTMLFAAARNSLMVNVARAWTTYIFNEAIYKLSQSQLKSVETTLDIVQSRYRVGLTEAADVYLTLSNVETQKIAVEQALEQTNLAAQRFYVLVGQYPASTIDLDREDGQVPQLLPLQKTLPSELLLRRPDVLSAHYRYLSALKNVDVRQKARYPSFSLNADIGTESGLLKRLVRFDEALWSVMAGVTQPIFNAGGLRSQWQQAELEAQAIKSDYFQTMLTAYSEVEASLTTEKSIYRQERINRLALEYAKYSLDQNRELYSQGLESIITVLSSEQQVFSTEINRLSLISQQVQNRLTLYLSLGGDFYSNSDWLQQFAEIIFEQPDHVELDIKDSQLRAVGADAINIDETNNNKTE